MQLVRTGTCLGVSLVHPYLTPKTQSQRSPTFCQHCDRCSGPTWENTAPPDQTHCLHLAAPRSTLQLH